MVKIKRGKLLAIAIGVGLFGTVLAVNPVRNHILSAEKSQAVGISTNYGKYQAYTELMNSGYKSMTVKGFRNFALDKLFNNGNEKENQKILDQIISDSEVRRLRFTDEISFFLRNVAVPLVSERWQSSFVEGAITRNIKGKTAVAEIKFRIDIKDSNMLIRDYEKVYSDTASAVQTLLDSKTLKQLKQGATMKRAVVAKLNKVATDVNALGKVKMTIANCECCIEDNEQQNYRISKKSKIEKEAEKLLTLKSDNYGAFSVLKFRNNLAANFDKDSSLLAAKEDVMRDLSSELPKLQLSEEDFNFIMYTLRSSISENDYLVTHRYKPAFRQRSYLYSKKFDFNLPYEYIVQYTVKDESRFTVEKRDKIIMSVVEGMNKYIKETKKDPGSSDYFAGYKRKLDSLVAANTSKDMKLVVEQCFGN